ncbi:DUF6059 family protein [Streptomyces sp. NPDC007205]|uniref:DUF6059 family protein n=1 Tax=Streptomyces sp. NPDC007205 TaxID=3154316 RepID=UPI0033D24D00
MTATRALRVLKVIYGTLVAAGRMYVWLPPTEPHPDCSDPPLLHPERLRPDVPLTAYERALERELTTGEQVP